jgi:CO/xanthine dehydrogenase FAD-binding subunit
MLPEFDLWVPKTLSEALDMLAQSPAPVTPVAGGTSLIPDLRVGRQRPAVLMDISRLAELRGIRREDGYLVVGAGTRIAELLTHPLIAQHADVLRQAAAVFANPLVRNRATIGGNLADAAPCADTAPPLIVLGGEVALTSRAGTRYVPVEKFMVDVRKTVRRPDELLTAVRWPLPATDSAAAFYKFGLRRADAIAVLSVAVMLTMGSDGRCREARIALGSVAPTPVRAPAAEELLRGQAPSSDLIAEAARLAAEAARPIDDIRGTAAYRRRVLGVVTRRLLTSVAGQLSKG